MFGLLNPSSDFELHTYVWAYHQLLSLGRSFLTFNLMMIAVIGACLERGLLPAAAIERGVIYVLAGDIAASRYTANPVISQQIMPFFRGILSNFFWISLTTLMWYIKLEKIGIVNIQCSNQLLCTRHFLIFTQPSATMSKLTQLTHQSSNIQRAVRVRTSNLC